MRDAQPRVAASPRRHVSARHWREGHTQLVNQRSSAARLCLPRQQATTTTRSAHQLGQTGLSRARWGHSASARRFGGPTTHPPERPAHWTPGRPVKRPRLRSHAATDG